MNQSNQCDLPGAALSEPGHDFPNPPEDLSEERGPQSVVLAGGCFWCVEAVFRQLKGVTAVVSGYAGGTRDTANYRSVCSGQTDHAEVIRVDYDPQIISFGQLLKVFFSTAHDPTQLNRQGNDIGSQYRSAIFYSSSDQQRVAESYIAKLNTLAVFKAEIATKLEALVVFYPAEDYHQDYAAQNPHQPYIEYVSMPKVEKLRSRFPESLKDR